jgi:hypothetical protein
VTSQLRVPVTVAPTLMAPIMHCMHMASGV